MDNIRHSIFLLIAFLLFGIHATSQDLSGVPVSIDLNQSTTLQALRMVDAIDGVKLSYNPDAIPIGRTITSSYQNEPVSKVLKEVLGDNFEYKYRGSYIIIQKKKQPEAKKKTFTLSGAVTDAKTGEVIEDVTIYEVNKLNSTLTDDRGNFELIVSSKKEYVTFSVSRENYQDTIIQVRDFEELSKSLVLEPSRPKEKKKRLFEIETKKLVQFFTPKKSQKNARNVSMEEVRFSQFSVLPKIGTNGALSGQVKNKFSFNLLAGYAGSLNGFELGGFYNIDRMGIKGLQMGGFGNAVGGESRGAQFGGFINTTKGYTTGLQVAGFFNLVSDDVKGVQLAGFLNIAKKTAGTQIAGFTNVATKNINGAQLSGFNAHAKDVDGAQVSGFINTAKNLKGFQLAGFFNYARKLKGVQLSVINIADSVETGAPIGLFNFVKHGLHQVAVEHNDFMPYNFTFRSGIHKFYTVITAGIKPSDDNLWSYGFGFGTQFELKNKLYGNVELVAHTIQKSGREDDDLNLLNRLNINFGYQIARRFSINTGPVVNLYLTKIQDPSTGQYGDLDHNSLYERIYEDLSLSLWVGYAVSLRF